MQFSLVFNYFLPLSSLFPFQYEDPTSKSRSEILEKIWNVVLEKDGEDQLDRSCEKCRSVTQSEWAEEYPTRNKKTEG
jgi:phage FluMu protein Com